MIEIRQVNDNKQGMKDFINFPYTLYRDNPNWCPPLHFERKAFFSNKNPFLHNIEVAYFVAYDGQNPVGRVTAHIDRLHNRYRNAREGFFGFYESIDSPDVARQLMETAETWVTKRGMTSLIGPYNFNSKQEVGFLVEGFDLPQSVMMTYTKDYYPRLFDGLGYRKARGYVSFRVSDILTIPAIVTGTARRLAGRYGASVQIIPLSKKKLDEEHDFILDVYNDAWSENWGFIPLNDAELGYIIDEFKSFAEFDFIYKLYVEGEPVAFMLVLPNINEVLMEIGNGRLLPTGILKLLFRRNRIRSAVIGIMGVKKPYWNRGFELLLYNRLFEDHRAKPQVDFIETTWILEDNERMIKSLEHLNAQSDKRYVILEKVFTP